MSSVRVFWWVLCWLQEWLCFVHASLYCVEGLSVHWCWVGTSDLLWSMGQFQVTRAEAWKSTGPRGFPFAALQARNHHLNKAGLACGMRRDPWPSCSITLADSLKAEALNASAADYRPTNESSWEQQKHCLAEPSPHCQPTELWALSMVVVLSH